MKNTENLPVSQLTRTRYHEVEEDIDEKLRILLEVPFKNDRVDSVQRKVKILYQKCMTYIDTDDALTRLQHFILTLGGWAVTGIHLNQVSE